MSGVSSAQAAGVSQQDEPVSPLMAMRLDVEKRIKVAGNDV